MRFLLKLLALSYFICYSATLFSQVDPTIPLPQRNLQNKLINPIINENPFMSKPPVIKPTPKNLTKPSTGPEFIEKPTPLKKDFMEQEEKIEEEVDEEEQPEEKKNESKSNQENQPRDPNDGMFGTFRIGPMVGFGILMGLNYSLETKFLDYIGLSVNYGGFTNLNLLSLPLIKSFINSSSTDFQLDKFALNYKQYEVKLSIFPIRTSFYIGAAYGRKTIGVNTTGRINLTVSNTPKTQINTPFNQLTEITTIYWTPQIGWLSTSGSPIGWFAFGSELGVQLPIHVSANTSVSFSNPEVAPFINAALQSAEYTEFTNQINNVVVSKLKKYPIPYWNIVKIGWIF